MRTYTKTLLTLGLILLPCLVNASQIRGKLQAPAGSPVYLFNYRMHVSDTLAHTKTDEDSLFLLPISGYHGFYRLAWQGGYADVLWDGHGISFIQTGPQTFDILRGDNWRNYRDSRNQLYVLRNNQNHINQLLRNFEGQGKLLKQAERQLKKLQKQEHKLIKEIRKATPDNLAHRFLTFEIPFVGRSPEALPEFMNRERYLELLDLSDTLQLYYNLLPQHIVSYFGLFEAQPNEDHEILAISFLNRVFDKLDENPIYFAPVADFLRIGFEQMDSPKGLHLIAQRVATQNACADPNLRAKINQSLYNYEKIKPGKKAKNIPGLVNMAGDTSEWEAATGLLVFWSSECPHCLQQLPDLHLWLKNNYPALQVTAISLDNYLPGWKAEIQLLDHWKHYRDPRSWDGAAVDLYLAKATPFFLLIDKEGKIVDSYRSIQAIRTAVSQLP
ncbi:MAG: TlpA family protein disulfide reductase [Bacteroidia bacterium]